MKAYAALCASFLLLVSNAWGQSVADMGAAREWCERTMLRGPEGIWEFPDDDTRVLVCRQAGFDRRYDIIVIETPDTRLRPGETIGELRESAVSSKYEMTLMRNRRKGILANPGKCLAELNGKEDAMIISARKLKLSLASRWFLPSFWRAVKVSVKDPLDNLPYGMVRIFPTSVRRHPDYL